MPRAERTSGGLRESCCSVPWEIRQLKGALQQELRWAYLISPVAVSRHVLSVGSISTCTVTWPTRYHTLHDLGENTSLILQTGHWPSYTDWSHATVCGGVWGDQDLWGTSPQYSAADQYAQNHVLGAVPPDPTRQRELAEDHSSPSSLPTWASSSWRALTGLVYQISPQNGRRISLKHTSGSGSWHILLDSAFFNTAKNISVWKLLQKNVVRCWLFFVTTHIHPFAFQFCDSQAIVVGWSEPSQDFSGFMAKN